MERDPRLAIARLAASVLIADDRVGPGERQALLGLEALGLGQLAPMVEREIARAVREPLEVAQACAALAELGPQAGAVIVAALTELAISDSDLASRELRLLRQIGAGLGLANDEIVQVLNAVLRRAERGMMPPEATGDEAHVAPMPKPAAPWVSDAPVYVDPPSADRRRALGMLGVAADADRDAIDTAYLAAVERYNPSSLRHLGADFVALAAHRLAEITAAYDLACAPGTTEHAAVY